MILQREGISLADLLAALKAPPAGRGAYDVLEALTAASEGASGDRDVESALDKLTIVDRFIGLRLSSEAAAAWDALGKEQAAAPAESVWPAQILSGLLAHDAALRDVCEASGLRRHSLLS